MSNKDFQKVLTHYKFTKGGAYQYVDVDRRQTLYSTNSPYVDGKLSKTENGIYRYWERTRGSGIHTLFIQHYPDNPSSYNLIGEGGFGAGHHDPLYLADLKEQAVTIALERFNDAVSNSQMQLMEYILERHDAKDSIVTMFKTLVAMRQELSLKKLFKNAKFYNKRTRKIEIRRIEMSLSEKWLAWSFFWQPLLADVYKIISGFTPVTSNAIRKRGFVSGSTYDKLDYGTSYHYCSTSYDVRATVKGAVRIDDPLLAILDEIGLADPAKLLWNATPFSFVVDWFINIGNLLDAVSTPGKSIVNSSVTLLVKFDSKTGGHTLRDPPWNGSVQTVGVGFHHQYAEYSRNVGPLPFPRLQLAGGIDSVWKIATSWALLSVLKGVK